MDISSMIMSVASNLLTSMFFSSDAEPETNLMEVFAECFAKLTDFVNTVRKEMHERFDRVDAKLEIIHSDLIYFCNNINSKLELLQASTEKSFSFVNFRLDIINNNVLSLENLVGEGFRELQWREVINKIEDYNNYYSRFNILIPTEYLMDLATTIENTILNSPCVDWLNRNYFNSKPHTKQIDDAYFANVDTTIYHGWLCENQALPGNIVNELLKVYQQLKFELARRNMSYDKDKIILTKLKDKIKSWKKSFSKEDVIKIADSIISSDLKIKEISDKITKEKFLPYLEKATELFIQKINEYVEDFNYHNQVGLYYNDNGSNVDSYIQDRLCMERDEFISQSKLDVKELTNYKIMIKYEYCNVIIKHYPIYESKICTELILLIKTQFKNFIKGENLGFGKLELAWELIISNDESKHFIRESHFFIGSTYEVNDNFGRIGPMFDGRQISCTFNIKAYWINSTSKTYLGSYSTTNSHSLVNNADCCSMVTSDGFISHHGGAYLSDHTLAMEATKIAGKKLGWSTFNKSTNFNASELIVNQKIDLEMVKIDKIIQDELKETIVLHQSTLIKNKRKLYALTENKDIYEKYNFIDLLKQSYKNTDSNYVARYTGQERISRSKLVFIQNKGFIRNIVFDTDFDTIMHNIPEYPVISTPCETTITTETVPVSRKDRIKQLFKELITCVERKEQIEKELEELLEE